MPGPDFTGQHVYMGWRLRRLVATPEVSVDEEVSCVKDLTIVPPSWLGRGQEP